MRVLVTGGTGFVGAHTTKAIVDAGHEVRLLVRDPARIATTVKSIGVDAADHTVGDMTDPASVRAAMDGCDAVVHAAAVVTLDRKRRDEVLRMNPAGTRTVLEAAVAHDLDPIVVVSSASALYDPSVKVLTTDLPPAESDSPYGRSKAESERIAREYQDQGAPVVLTYPGGVIGPPVGGNFGETGGALVAHMKAQSLPVRDAAISLVDARDVAAIHAAVLEAGRGPRRYMCCGQRFTMPELAAVYRTLTGKRFPVVPIPGAGMRAAGRVLDRLRKVLPIETVITEEGMVMYTQWPGSDDHAIFDELGISYRPIATTLHDTLLALHGAGLVTAKQIGRLAAED